MKKINYFIILFWAAASLPVFAQLEPGRAFVGGGLSASFPVSESKSLSVSLLPEYAVVKSPSRILGLAAPLGFSSSKVANSLNKENSTTLGISPFVQQVFPLSKQFYLTMTGTAGLSLITTNKEQTAVQTKNTALALGLSARPGIMYLLQNRWMLRLDVGNARILSFQQANTTEIRSSRETKTNEFSYDFRTTYGFSGTQIGLYYFIK